MEIDRLFTRNAHRAFRRHCLEYPLYPAREPAMAHYILIDADSGYIWGDTRDLAGKSVPFDSIIDAARALDETVVGQVGRIYEEVSDLRGKSGYHVYRVDIGGSEAVAVIHDGQDQETIEAVMRDCRFVGCVRITLPEE